MTHAQHYAACECIKNHRQWSLDGRPNAEEAAKKLSELLGFPVSESAIPGIKQATGIDWVAKIRRIAGPARANNSEVLQVLTIALHRLYRKLGEEVPQNLIDLYATFQGKEGAES